MYVPNTAEDNQNEYYSRRGKHVNKQDFTKQFLSEIKNAGKD